MKTAKALGLDVPTSILLSADERSNRNTATQEGIADGGNRFQARTSYSAVGYVGWPRDIEASRRRRCRARWARSDQRCDARRDGADRDSGPGAYHSAVSSSICLRLSLPSSGSRVMSSRSAQHRAWHLVAIVELTRRTFLTVALIHIV